MASGSNLGLRRAAPDRWRTVGSRWLGRFCTLAIRIFGPPRPNSISSPSSRDACLIRCPFSQVPLRLPASTSRYLPSWLRISACRPDASRSTSGSKFRSLSGMRPIRIKSCSNSSSRPASAPLVWRRRITIGLNRWAELVGLRSVFQPRLARLHPPESRLPHEPRCDRSRESAGATPLGQTVTARSFAHSRRALPP